jgi:hypothetical protein
MKQNKKNILFAFVAVLAVLVAFNWKNISKGFKEGWNSAK